MRVLLWVALSVQVLLLSFAAVEFLALSDIWKDFASPRLMEQHGVALPAWTQCVGEWRAVVGLLYARAGLLVVSVGLLAWVAWSKKTIPA